ncbi:MAG: ATP-binding protein [Spirochaetaceae bacterium]
MKRILLCIGNTDDREKLAEWLGGGQEVITTGDRVCPETPFDLCIVDPSALEANRKAIRARREAERPEFLPLVLLARRKQPAEDHRRLLSEVDEVIWTPVERAEIEARVTALLRIRSLTRLVRRRYQALANQSSAAVLVLRTGIIRYANRTAGRMCPDLAVGMEFTALIAPDHRPALDDYMKRLSHRARGDDTEDAVPLPTHVELRLNTEEERWVHVNASPTFEEDDREFLVMLLDITETKRRERELRESRRRIQALAGQLVSVEQRERAVLAANIHDGVNQSLASLRMRLDLLAAAPEREDLEAELADMRRLLDDAISQVRSLIVELDPPVIRESGLVATLSWLVEHFQKQHGLDVRMNAPAESITVPRDLQHVLYRATRELLFNVLKHAPGARAEVTVNRQDAQIVVQVSDDGPGFDPETICSGSGFGLAGLRDRLRPFGGTVEIRSAPGKGAIIEQRVRHPHAREEEPYEEASTPR